MEQIADRAEVGVATVYNYFGSKGALLSGLVRPLFESFFERGDAMIAEPGDDPTAGVQTLLSIYLELLDAWQGPGMLAAFPGPGLSAEPALDDLTREAEAMVKAQLTALLHAYQARGVLAPGFHAPDAAYVLFAVFNQHYLEAVVGQPQPGFDDDRHRVLARQARLVVDALRAKASCA